MTVDGLELDARRTFYWARRQRRLGGGNRRLARLTRDGRDLSWRVYTVRPAAGEVAWASTGHSMVHAVARVTTLLHDSGDRFTVTTWRCGPETWRHAMGVLAPQSVCRRCHAGETGGLGGTVLLDGRDERTVPGG